MTIDYRSLETRARVTLPDGGVAIEASRVRRVALAWEELPEDSDADPFDAPAPAPTFVDLMCPLPRCPWVPGHSGPCVRTRPALPVHRG